MTSKGEFPFLRDVDAGIASVLEAERAAHTAIADSEREAAGLVAAAQDRARHIAERAAQRIAALRAGMAEKFAASLATIDDAGAPHDAAADHGEPARIGIDRAVARLAEELAGRTP